MPKKVSTQVLRFHVFCLTCSVPWSIILARLYDEFWSCCCFLLVSFFARQPWRRFLSRLRGQATRNTGKTNFGDRRTTIASRRHPGRAFLALLSHSKVWSLKLFRVSLRMGRIGRQVKLAQNLVTWAVLWNHAIVCNVRRGCHRGEVHHCDVLRGWNALRFTSYNRNSLRPQRCLADLTLQWQITISVISVVR